MITPPLRYARGDTLRIQEADTTVALWRVVERNGRGWKLEPFLGGDTRTLSDLEIRDRRRWIEHYRCDPRGLSEDHAALLKKAFSAYPHERRKVATRRAAFLDEIEDLRREQGLTLDECYLRVPSVVSGRLGETWRTEDREDAAREEERRARRRKLPEEFRSGPSSNDREIKAPQPSTVKAWHQLWMTAGQDIRVLIPLFDKRGNRTPRKIGEEAVIYDLMDHYVREIYLQDLKGGLKSVWRILNKELEDKGLSVSYTTFRLFKDKICTDYEETKARTNWRQARHEHDVFKRSKPPANPLDEIEIDHSLLDIIIVHENGRPLGRPWLTLALDRRTRMILGIHVSFEPPSFASLQRCLAHAFWPKDLAGLGLRNPWPCEGVPRLIFTDNGKEFLSRSLRECERAMHFTVMNLPPRQPWLKGRVERIFGRIAIQVFDLLEGKTFSNALKKGEYNSVRRASMTLAELKRKLLVYIVDDYHVSYHEGLKGVPLEEWIKHTDREFVDGVRSFDDIQTLLGATFLKPITKRGINLFGLVYYSDKLRPLRKRRDGNKKRWQVRCNPFNLESVELLDDDSGEWIKLDSDEPAIARNVSIHQARVHHKRAKQIAKGQAVKAPDIAGAARMVRAENEAILGDAEAKTTATAAARYVLDNGAFFTPLAGQREAEEKLAEAALSNDNRPSEMPTSAGGPSDAVAPVDEPGGGEEDADEMREFMAAAARRWAERK